MKIQTSNGTDTMRQINVRRATTNNTDETAGSVRKAGAVAMGSSAVNLSSVAGVAASLSDMDTAKVQSIKAALQRGTYTVDSAAVANGMLRTARDFLATTSSGTGARSGLAH
ncbi:Anti-sigma-28 factor, FlgM family (fragment) [Burkholderia sp. 8Y]|uniref:flagellar biosynthesis anti-sigma factor FlgM n=1 Tax=Burkholderia sp. 8Y TaxID=2653133 RepID=UPI0012F0F46E